MTIKLQAAENRLGNFYCPCCGLGCEILTEGYCHPCYRSRQQELDEHNARFDWWESLDDKERDNQIRLRY